MSDNLASAKQALPGVPDELVMRSARARATAQGVSVDDVLGSWSSGGPLTAASPTATASPAPAPEVAPEVATPVATEAPTPAPSGPGPVAAAAAATVAVGLAAPEEPAFDPVPLGRRLVVGWRLGSVLGALTGVIAAVTGLALTIDATIVVEAGPAVAVDPSRVVIALAAMFGVAGPLIARVVATLPGRVLPDHRVEPRGGVIGITGLVAGAVLGAVTGTMVAGRGEEIIGAEATVAVPTIPAFLLVVVLGIVSGAAIGMLAQVVTLPSGLGETELAASEAVRKRLSTGYGAPLLILASAALIIVGLGRIFLLAPSLAPLVAVVVAGGILTFAFLATSRPEMRVGRTELAVALGGLAIVVLFIALVANSLGLTHHGDEDHGDDASSEVARLVT